MRCWARHSSPCVDKRDTTSITISVFIFKVSKRVYMWQKRTLLTTLKNSRVVYLLFFFAHSNQKESAWYLSADIITFPFRTYRCSYFLIFTYLSYIGDILYYRLMSTFRNIFPLGFPFAFRVLLLPDFHFRGVQQFTMRNQH